MPAQSQNDTWYEGFFTGAALDLWRHAIPLETTEQELAFLQEVLGAPDGGKLLDLPCGYGRLSLPLSLLGYAMTGIDTCEQYLLDASKAAKSHNTKIDYIKCDMRKFASGTTYDGALCMGNSFGYFNREGTRQFFAAAANSLKPGAKFVLDTAMIAECFLVNGGEKEWYQVDNIYMLTENRYDCRQSCLDTTYTFIQNGKVEERQAVHWIYTSAELCWMMEQEGLSVLELYGNTEFDPFAPGAERLLLVSQKC